MSGAHAFLPPSGASAWAACAMWPTMNAKYPQDDTEESREGTAAHYVFELTFGNQVATVGMLAPNGVAITQEMLDGGRMYTERIDADLAACGLDRCWLQVEKTVAIPQVHQQNWGTPDTWFYDPTGNTLYIYDYKFGHLFVDAYWNWQCIDYAAGIVDSLREYYGAECLYSLRVAITVVQPRNYDGDGFVRTWSCKLVDLQSQWAHLRKAAERALSPKPSATPGIEQCQYCPGRHACVPLQREGYKGKHLSMQSVPVELTPSALSYEYTMLVEAEKLLKARRTGLEEQLVGRIKRGESAPGYGLEPTMSRESFARPAEVIAVAQMMGFDITKPPEVITPKQAAAVGLPESVIQLYRVRSQTGMKLVRDDGRKAEKAFAQTS